MPQTKQVISIHKTSHKYINRSYPHITLKLVHNLDQPRPIIGPHALAMTSNHQVSNMIINIILKNSIRSCTNTTYAIHQISPSKSLLVKPSLEPGSHLLSKQDSIQSPDQNQLIRYEYEYHEQANSITRLYQSLPSTLR